MRFHPFSEQIFVNYFCGQKNTAGKSRGDIRKRRRKRAAFAGLQRQSPLTTTKGAGAAQAAKNPVGSSTGQGGLRSRAGACLTRSQPTSGLFLALPSKSGLFRCKAVRVRGAAKTPVGSWTGWAVCESRAGASLTRPQPVPQDFGCRKCEKGQSKPWWLACPFEHFMRQNPKAEPLFSYATPAKPAVSGFCGWICSPDHIWARVSSMAGIICFLRLTTPGRTTLPSVSRSQRKAAPISCSAPSPQNSTLLD